MTQSPTPSRRPLWPLLVGLVGAAAIATATLGAATSDDAGAATAAAATTTVAAAERPAPDCPPTDGAGTPAGRPL
jgi:hypothetical protein